LLEASSHDGKPSIYGSRGTGTATMIPRAGTRVTRAFQRTRWRDGRTFVWVAMSRETGRGEDRSRLAFDQIPASAHATAG